jgi:Putative restriction endonuclease
MELVPGNDDVRLSSPGVKLTYDDFRCFPTMGSGTSQRRLYERSEVSDFWVVDPEIDVIRVYRRGAKGFERPHELCAEAGDTLSTPLLPGLSVPLFRIFRT